MPHPLNCLPLAGGMKPGYPWSWTWKPPCYKPQSCCGVAATGASQSSIPLCQGGKEQNQALMETGQDPSLL